MSLVEFACIGLGVLNGVFLALMPKTNDPRPSVFKLFGFGTVLSAALVFLAAAATMDHFPSTLAMAAILGLLTFVVTKSLSEARPHGVATVPDAPSPGLNKAKITA